MKLNYSAVVVVLNSHTNFRDDMLKSSLHTQMDKVGGKR